MEWQAGSEEGLGLQGQLGAAELLEARSDCMTTTPRAHQKENKRQGTAAKPAKKQHVPRAQPASAENEYDEAAHVIDDHAVSPLTRPMSHTKGCSAPGSKP